MRSRFSRSSNSLKLPACTLPAGLHHEAKSAKCYLALGLLLVTRLRPDAELHQAVWPGASEAWRLRILLICSNALPPSVIFDELQLPEPGSE